jgi:hypothetical protein
MGRNALPEQKRPKNHFCNAAPEHCDENQTDSVNAANRLSGKVSAVARPAPAAVLKRKGRRARRQRMEEPPVQPLTPCAELRPGLSSDKLIGRLRLWSSGHNLRVFVRRSASGPSGRTR